MARNHLGSARDNNLVSYEGFWVTRRDQAAWFTGASRTSMPSLNLTPATIFGK